jgi:class 3 adenylate cyclase
MIDLSVLSMTDIIRLQNQLQEELTRRFERPLALLFSDIVGSTAYFARFGDAAGRQLQQRHVDLLTASVLRCEGRVVDTVGDGAFIVFGSVDQALAAILTFHDALARANATRERQQQLSVRMGLHWGAVLSDGNAVSGDAVNMCSRVAASAKPGDVRLTRAAFHEITSAHRLSCRSAGQATLAGFSDPVELLVLDWRDQSLYPRSFRMEDTGEVLALPQQDIVSFGRLPDHAGVRANDVVLTHADPNLLRQISRWHFELRRSDSGLTLLALSDSGTLVDGRRVARGESVQVRAGSRIGVGDVLTLQLLAAGEVETNATTKVHKAADTLGLGRLADG